MFIVYERDTGEMVYTADAEAIQCLDATRYQWEHVPDDWSMTNVWNPYNRALEPIPVSD